jgi:hypothetical protein
MRTARLLAVVVGAIAAAVLAVSFAADARALDRGWLAWWPECAARRAGSSCGLCGMSHAFVAIAHGRFQEVRGYNAHALWLYPAFVASAFAGLCAMVRNFRRGKRGGNSRP